VALTRIIAVLFVNSANALSATSMTSLMDKIYSRYDVVSINTIKTTPLHNIPRLESISYRVLLFPSVIGGSGFLGLPALLTSISRAALENCMYWL